MKTALSLIIVVTLCCLATVEVSCGAQTAPAATKEPEAARDGADELGKETQALADLEAELAKLSGRYARETEARMEDALPLATTPDAEAEPAVSSPRRAIRSADLLFEGGHFVAALTRYRSAAKDSADALDGAWTSFQIGNCLYHLGKYDEALAAYLTVERDFADSPWLEQAAWRADMARWKSQWIARCEGAEEETPGDT